MERKTVKLGDPPAPAGAGVIRVLAVLLALSLALHAATIYTLWQARSAARTQALTLAAEIGDAGQDVIRVSVPLNQPIPVQASVPIRKTINVPISTTIPLDTEFDVPVRTPLGTYQVTVPFKHDVPIRLTAPVTLDETVQISTTVTLDTELALALPVSETPLAAYLTRLRQGLLDLAEQL